jgi:excisionase family DNA binding protein
MYSVKEAAIKLEISERRIRKLLEEERIKGRKLGRDWVVLDLNYTRKRQPKRKKGESNEREIT